MGTIRLFDEAAQFRIEVEGRFAGTAVIEVRNYWELALGETSSRQFVIDISQLSGYDNAGYLLLQEMEEHGTVISARNARALTFLHEISSPEPQGPHLVYKSPAGEKKGNGSEQPSKLRNRAAAAGE